MVGFDISSHIVASNTWSGSTNANVHFVAVPNHELVNYTWLYGSGTGSGCNNWCMDCPNEWYGVKMIPMVNMLNMLTDQSQPPAYWFHASFHSQKGTRSTEHGSIWIFSPWRKTQWTSAQRRRARKLSPQCFSASRIHFCHTKKDNWHESWGFGFPWEVLLSWSSPWQLLALQWLRYRPGTFLHPWTMVTNKTMVQCSWGLNINDHITFFSSFIQTSVPYSLQMRDWCFIWSIRISVIHGVSYYFRTIMHELQFPIIREVSPSIFLKQYLSFSFSLCDLHPNHAVPSTAAEPNGCTGEG